MRKLLLSHIMRSGLGFVRVWESFLPGSTVCYQHATSFTPHQRSLGCTIRKAAVHIQRHSGQICLVAAAVYYCIH